MAFVLTFCNSNPLFHFRDVLILKLAYRVFDSGGSITGGA
jgi:hypothetical protein